MSSRAPRATCASGSHALTLLHQEIAGARKRIWVMQFTVDARPTEDLHGEIRELLDALGIAAANRVDVRVLLPVLRDASDGHDRNEPAARYLCTRGVSVRRYRSEQRPLLHGKLVVIDDWCFVSNINWTAAAFRLNTELGLAVEGDAVARIAASYERTWSTRAHACCAGPAHPSYAAAIVRARAAVPPVHVRHDDYTESHSLRGERVKMLAGQEYAREVAKLIDGAGWRVWVAMYGLRATTAKRTRVLVDALHRACERRVEVRVLYDARPERTDMAADLPHLRDAGAEIHAWPLHGRFHVRGLLVDQSHVVIGSVAWTPQSIFLAEDQALHVEDTGVGEDVAKRFDGWWKLACTQPDEWPVHALGLPSHHTAMLEQTGMKTLAQVRDHGTWARTMTPAELRVARIAAHWMTKHRMPPAVALSLGHAQLESFDALAKLGSRERIAAKLHAEPNVEHAHRLAPVSSFLARFVDRVASGTAARAKPSLRKSRSTP